MKFLPAAAFVVFAVGTSLAPARADDLRTSLVEVQLEAGAAFFKPWSSGLTYHSGVGYIKPYGPAEYACGNGYEEAKNHPVPEGLKSWFAAHAADTNPLFCVYRLPQGNLYTLDVLVGNIQTDKAAGVRVDEVTNVVIGGTGAFKNASGLWTGTTSGRGTMHAVRSGYELPDSILKLMTGYLRLPAR